jgi:nucleoside-diphosphate-sugar epimerase
MKICITGIAGFFGSALAKHLVNDGHEVTGIDSLAWGYEEDIPKECEWAPADLVYLDRWIKGDLPKYPAYLVLKDVDLMIHCAANLEVMESLAEPTSDLRVNTEGTIQVLEAMKLYSIPRLINFSSACVYGAGTELMSPVSEEDVRTSSPHWPYGASKLAAEVYCNLYAKAFNIGVTNLRPGIVCGPGEWYGRALTIFLRRALEGKPIPVFVDKGWPEKEGTARLMGCDGTVKRDFVHINDVVQMVRALVDTPFAGYRTFNLGSGAQHSILQLARAVSSHLGAEVVFEEVEPGEESENVTGRVRIPHEMKCMYLSIYNAKQALNFVPYSSTLSRIIDDEVTWLKGGGLKRWQETGMKV